MRENPHAANISLDGSKRTLIFLAALRNDRIDAPLLVDAAINGDLFLLYVEQVLVPTPKPANIVVIDWQF